MKFFVYNEKMLGELTPSEFLREYWQKKPLLIRNAFPGFSGLVSPGELIELSGYEDAQSRLVAFDGQNWTLENGPFEKKRFRKLSGHWTLLVQGVNHFLPEGDALLSRFDFVPRARLDDLMVSYAPDGGGVGPHFDSYDVFLLQGLGRRKWQIASDTPEDLIPDAPLRILSRFEARQEWILEPGDMLYLPPKYAHNGVAVGESMTYSIGFRAPSAQELAVQFLAYLQERIELGGLYSDPDLALQAHPAEIGTTMIGKVEEMISGISWNGKDIEHFLGTYLSEPKPHVYFDPPGRRMPLAKFRSAVAKSGLRLDLRTQMLFTRDDLYLNGERIGFAGLDANLLKQLADSRHLPPCELPAETAARLHEWLGYGYLEIGPIP